MNALVFEALGSNFNRKDFVVCEREINAYKEKLWSGKSPMAAGKPAATFEKLVAAANVGKTPSNKYLSGFRTVRNSSIANECDLTNESHQTIAVFSYMNSATVRANLVESTNNVMMELRNTRELTGETTESASIWQAFMRRKVVDMETHGKTWLNARIKYANTELVKTVKKCQRMNANLKKEEKNSEWNKKQNRKRLRLNTQLKKQRDDMLTAGHSLRAVEKERNKILKQIRTANAATKKRLKIEKDELTEKIVEEKNVLEQAEEAVSQTQRNILELTAAGVQQIIRNLQKDKQTLRRYSSLVSAL